VSSTDIAAARIHSLQQRSRRQRQERICAYQAQGGEMPEDKQTTTFFVALG
jgi:hypothetical protein